jgi:hypothetical protein
MVERIAKKEVIPELGCGVATSAGERLRIYYRLLVKEDMASVFLQYSIEEKQRCGLELLRFVCKICRDGVDMKCRG